VCVDILTRSSNRGISCNLHPALHQRSSSTRRTNFQVNMDRIHEADARLRLRELEKKLLEAKEEAEKAQLRIQIAEENKKIAELMAKL